ncbi:MAG: CDP-alcohol phosphatidyltransferase family protein [Thermodesulfobacteriota bacterium]|jgi:phosphatidylglycerophosphate synthase
MLDSYASRPGWLDTLLTALARKLLRLGIGANSLTFFALLSGITAGLLFYARYPLAALLCCALSGLADAVDGRVARLGGGATPWGGVLDLVCDRVVEVAVLLGIALPHPHLHVPALVLAATWYVNLCVFLAVGAASERGREKVIVYPPGLVERGEALFFAALAGLWPEWAAPLGYTYAGLEVVTAAQRFLAGKRELSA